MLSSQVSLESRINRRCRKTLILRNWLVRWGLGGRVLSTIHRAAGSQLDTQVGQAGAELEALRPNSFFSRKLEFHTSGLQLIR